MTILCGISVFADNGLPIEMFYDFDNYSCSWDSISLAEKQLPDEHWGHDGTHHRFGAVRAEDGKKPTGASGEDVAMALGSWHGTRLWFDDALTNGQIHISFDLKFVGMDEDPGQYMSMKFDKGTKTNPRETGDVATIFKINPGQNTFEYYANGSGSGGSVVDLASVSGGEINMAEGWHRIDIYSGDMNASSGGFKVYIDGYQVSAGGVNNKALNGIRSFYAYHICTTYSGESWDVQLRRFMMIDNLSVSRFESSIDGLRAISTGNEYVPLSDGSVSFRLSEPVSASESEIKNAMSIMNIRDGELSKARYSVEKTAEDKITVNFSGSIPAGKYTLILGGNIVGDVLGLPMKSPVEFRTAAEYIDGVIRPEIESVEYINYDGNSVNVSEGAPSTLVNVYVNFNTNIDDDSLKNAISFTSDDEEPIYEVRVEQNGTAERAVVSFPKLLGQECSYNFSVAEGIAAEDNTNVMSNYGVSQSFVTKKDASFGIFENRCENGKYIVKCAKNNSSGGKWTIAVASYDKVTGADGAAYKKLRSIEYKAFELDETDKGVFEYELSYDEAADEVCTFIWKWPSNFTTGIYQGQTGDL